VIQVSGRQTLTNGSCVTPLHGWHHRIIHEDRAHPAPAHGAVSGGLEDGGDIGLKHDLDGGGVNLGADQLRPADRPVPVFQNEGVQRLDVDVEKIDLLAGHFPGEEFLDVDAGNIRASEIDLAARLVGIDQILAEKSVDQRFGEAVIFQKAGAVGNADVDRAIPRPQRGIQREKIRIWLDADSAPSGAIELVGVGMVDRVRRAEIEVSAGRVFLEDGQEQALQQQVFRFDGITCSRRQQFGSGRGLFGAE